MYCTSLQCKKYLYEPDEAEMALMEHIYIYIHVYIYGDHVGTSGDYSVKMRAKTENNYREFEYINKLTDKLR